MAVKREFMVLAVDKLPGSNAIKALVRGTMTIECFVKDGKVECPRNGGYRLVSEEGFINDIPAVVGVHTMTERPVESKPLPGGLGG